MRPITAQWAGLGRGAYTEEAGGASSERRRSTRNTSFYLYYFTVNIRTFTAVQNVSTFATSGSDASWEAAAVESGSAPPIGPTPGFLFHFPSRCRLPHLKVGEKKVKVVVVGGPAPLAPGGGEVM